MPSEQPSCPTCGAPVLRTVCTSLICPTNLEGLDDVEELESFLRAMP